MCVLYNIYIYLHKRPISSPLEKIDVDAIDIRRTLRNSSIMFATTHHVLPLPITSRATITQHITCYHYPSQHIT